MIDAPILSGDYGCNLDELVNTVLNEGERVDSRYGPCEEILGGTLICETGVLIARPGINYSLGWMEMYQLLAGVYSLADIQRIAPNADHSLFTYDMAYGPRVVDQIPAIIAALKKDPLTRQAVVFVGKPENGPTSSLPCTIAIQFLIREEILHTNVTMRSWDLCRGLPYDVMMFSGLSAVVARCVGVETGDMAVSAGSAHIYHDQMKKLPRMAPKKWEFSVEVPYDWEECKIWFSYGIPWMMKGETPDSIVLVDL